MLTMTNILVYNFKDSKIRYLDTVIDDIRTQISYRLFLGNGLYGELNPNPSKIINLSNISHRIDDCQIINGYLYANITILNTPNGKIIQEMNQKTTPYNMIKFQLRCLNTVKDNIVIDSKFITIDAISEYRSYPLIKFKKPKTYINI